MKPAEIRKQIDAKTLDLFLEFHKLSNKVGYNQALKEVEKLIDEMSFDEDVCYFHLDKSIDWDMIKEDIKSKIKELEK